MSAGNLPVAIQADGDPDEAETLLRCLQAKSLSAHLVREDAGREQLRSGRVSLVVVPGARRYEYYFDPERTDSRLDRYRVDDLVQQWKGGKAAWPTLDHPASEPGDRYIDFLIPGLMGYNLMTGGLWGVGFVVVDLRVRKLLKRFLATPMRRPDFLLAIVGSRLVFVIPEMVILMLAGHVLFGVPVHGNPLTLALLILLGATAFAGLGLLLASRGERVETVSGLINVLAMPLWMFSGTFFSAARFPPAVQPLLLLSPLTHLNDALRAVMLEGASLAEIGWRLLILAGWTVVTLFLAVKWFRWH
jgi:ABC-type multidrug transport system permease subunit